MSDRDRRRDYRSRSRSPADYRHRGGSGERDRDRYSDYRHRRDSRERDSHRYRDNSPRVSRKSGGLSNPPKDHPDANPGNNLYVSGIAHECTEEQLREEFKKYGSLKDVRIVLDPHTRESRGFGFVTFDESNDAEQAVKEMDGVEICKRPIKVERARRCRPHDSTPGTYCGPAGASSKFRRDRDYRRRRSPSPGYYRRRSYSR